MKSPCLNLQRGTATSAIKQPVRLERTFVETGDERCPIAGIWLKIVDTDLPADEPALTRPAIDIRPWRAFHLRTTRFCYSAA
jgi:hypothetical protein